MDPRSSRVGLGRKAVWLVPVAVLVVAWVVAKERATQHGTGATLVGRCIASLRPPETSGKWLAIHILSPRSGCSTRVADHLAHTARPTAWRELVLWAGDGSTPFDLSASGFLVERVTTTQLAQLGIEGAPTLVALDPSNRVRYAGGYVDARSGSALVDLRILGEAIERSRVASLPIGCVEPSSFAASSYPSCRAR
jgi:hypothetical protein